MTELTDLTAATAAEVSVPAAPAVAQVAHATPGGPISLRFWPYGLVVSRGPVSVGIPLASLLALALAHEPTLLPDSKAPAKPA